MEFIAGTIAEFIGSFGLIYIIGRLLHMILRRWIKAQTRAYIVAFLVFIISLIIRPDGFLFYLIADIIILFWDLYGAKKPGYAFSGDPLPLESIVAEEHIKIEREIGKLKLGMNITQFKENIENIEAPEFALFLSKQFFSLDEQYFEVLDPISFPMVPDGQVINIMCAFYKEHLYKVGITFSIDERNTVENNLKSKYGKPTEKKKTPPLCWTYWENESMPWRRQRFGIWTGSWIIWEDESTRIEIKQNDPTKYNLFLTDKKEIK